MLTLVLSLKNQANSHRVKDTTGTSLNGRKPGKAGVPGWVSGKKTCELPVRLPVLLVPMQAYMLVWLPRVVTMKRLR